jgi:hypothetical protein
VHSNKQRGLHSLLWLLQERLLSWISGEPVPLVSNQPYLQRFLSHLSLVPLWEDVVCNS